jgi:hypothetical protein
VRFSNACNLRRSRSAAQLHVGNHPASKGVTERYEGLWRSPSKPTTSRCETSITRRCRRSCSHRELFWCRTHARQPCSFATRLEGTCGFVLAPSSGENRSVLSFSDRGKSSDEVWDDADRSGLTFSLPPGNASLSMGPNARHACAMQLLILLAYSPTQTYNTPRSGPMSGARCDCGSSPHESMEMPLQAYAWLARAGDEHRSVVHRALALAGGPGAFLPSSHRARARPTDRSAPPRWTLLGSLAE